MKVWSMLLGAVAAIAVITVGAILVVGGDDDDKPGARQASAQAQALPQFALNYPKSWARVEASARDGEKPRAVIRRKDGSALMTMTINGPVKQSLAELRSDMQQKLRQRFPDMQKLQFKRIDVEAGSGLLSTWVSETGRIQSNLVVPSGKVSYSLDAVVSPGHPKTATEVGKIYAAFDAAPAR